MARKSRDLLGKEELSSLNEKDAGRTREFDPRFRRRETIEEISKKESLLYEYGFTGNIDSKNMDLKSITSDDSSDDFSLGPDSLISNKGVSIDYIALKQDIKKLEDYEELAKEYRLTPEQFEIVGDIYGRVKEATLSVEKLGQDYKQMSERLNEMAEFSKKMMEDISSNNYVKDISEYRHMP